MKKIKNQIDGKEETFRPTTLDQILGDTGTSKYKTMDVVVYSDKLSGMNKSDLQSHAVQVGIIPIDDRRILVERLTREFKRHVAAFRAPHEPQVPQIKVDKELQAILNQGR